MAEHGRVRSFEEAIGDLRRHQDTTERGIARGDALGHRHQVRADAPSLGRELPTRSAEAGDHLVGDQEDVVTTAELLESLQVALGRTDHTTRPDDGLGDDRRDVLGSELRHRPAYRVDVVGGDPSRLRDQRRRAVAIAVVLQPGDARPERVEAVIAAVTAEDDLLVGAPFELPVAPGQLAREVDRVRSTAGQHDLGARDGPHLGQPIGQHERRLVREASERVIGLQLHHLVVRGARQALATVADVGVPQAGRGIQQPLSGRRLQPRALSSRDHEALGASSGHVRLRVPERCACFSVSGGRHVFNCRTVEL